MLVERTVGILRRRLVLGLALAWMVAAAPRPAYAQILYGSLVGNVTDASGAAIPGAEIVITNAETNLVRSQTANEAGVFAFNTIPGGSYTVQASREGFSTYNRTDVAVAVNAVTRVDISLEVGQVTEVVEVTSSAPALQADRSEVRAEVESKSLHSTTRVSSPSARMTRTRAPSRWWTRKRAPSSWHTREWWSTLPARGPTS